MSKQKVIWSFVGGKGLVEKGHAAANIACGLALKGERVLLIDADMTGAGIHALLGISKPLRVFEEFLCGTQTDLSVLSLESGVRGLRLVSGGAGFLKLADPDFPLRKRLLKEVWALDASHIIVNIGQGASADILDFFSLSDEGVLVLSPEPDSVKGAFEFLRGLVYRRLAMLFSDDLALSVLISEATDARGPNPVKTFSDLCERISSVDKDGAQRAISEIKRVKPRLLISESVPLDGIGAADALIFAAKRFLSLEMDIIGSIRMVSEAGKPLFMLDDEAGQERKDIEDVISRLIGEGPGVRSEAPAPSEAISLSAPVAEAQVQEVFGFNDNVYHEDSVVHVQTEVQGGDDPSIETIVYHGGRIFFSKKTLWSSLDPDTVSAGIKDFATRQHRVAIAAVKLNKISIKG